MTDSNPLPLITEQEINPVPLFSCHIILSKADDRGIINGRTANFAGITASGSSERDVLTSLSKQFKDTVMRLHADKQPIPLIEPPESPQAGEVERFIPVHL